MGTSIVVAGTGTDGPHQALEEVLKTAGVKEEDVAYTIATGYGRKRFEGADGELSELSCHARGVHFTFPDPSLGFSTILFGTFFHTDSH